MSNKEVELDLQIAYIPHWRDSDLQISVVSPLFKNKSVTYSVDEILDIVQSYYEGEEEELKNELTKMYCILNTGE